MGWFYVVFMVCFLSCLWHVFLEYFVTSIGRVLWLVKRVVLRTILGQNSVYWRSHELSSTLLHAIWCSCVEPTCYIMEAMLLHGWASKFQLSGTLLRWIWPNCVAMHTFKPPTLDDHIFLVEFLFVRS